MERDDRPIERGAQLSLWHHSISLLSATALAIGQIAPAWAQDSRVETVEPNEQGTFSRSDYENCQTTDEAAFRKAIRSITLRALKKGTATLDYRAIVHDQWRIGDLDRIVDKRVDVAVAQVREETAWSELLKSLAYRKQAQELAQATAERTYRSDEIKVALEALATKVGREIGRAIVLTTADAALPAQRCLQAYLGPRYGATVARSVSQDTSAAFEIDPKTNQAKVSTGNVLLETSSGITGAVLLLVRRQMSRMARRLGQRLVGSILGRLVSVVAGGVGIVLIAKEFWELRYGVLPIIATEMKSAGSKAKVREEVADSIQAQIAAHLGELAGRTADKIVDIWHDFRRGHAKVVQLAERDAKFKEFLDGARPVQLARLDEIVALLIEKEGDGAVQSRLADGTLHLALNKMPEEGMQIAREQQSLSDALAWTALAGDKLAKVVEFDIHKRADPRTFSRASLARVLALGDRLAISRVAGVGHDVRDVLLELDRDKIIDLSRALGAAELQVMAGYLTRLSSPASQRLLRIVAERPAAMQVLMSERVREAILASRDQTAAVGMILTTSSPWDVIAIAEHVGLVWSGRVSPILMWDKVPGGVAGAAIALLLLLMLLRSMLFRRRQRRAHSGTPAQ